MLQACISKSLVCDWTDDCGLAEDEQSCADYHAATFTESGDMGWWSQGVNGQEDDIDWIRGSGMSSLRSKESFHKIINNIDEENKMIII